MKKIMFATIVAVAAISGFIGYSKATTSSLNALALANVEALSDDDETPPCVGESCSEINGTASCVKRNGEWVCMRITSVREYTRTSCIEICHHDRVTYCPAGTYER